MQPPAHNYTIIGLLHGCFLVNVPKIFWTAFLENTSGQLLLNFLHFSKLEYPRLPWERSGSMNLTLRSSLAVIYLHFYYSRNLSQVFSCKSSKNFQGNFFRKPLWKAASKLFNTWISLILHASCWHKYLYREQVLKKMNKITTTHSSARYDREQ